MPNDENLILVFIPPLANVLAFAKKKKGSPLTQTEAESERGAAQPFRSFGIYLLAECKPGGFVSGRTFSMEKDSPRYRVVWEPCDTYAKADYFHNPFGRWRLGEPGAA